MNLEIVPMTEAYYPRFRENHLDTADFSRSFGITESSARAIAEKNFSEHLPEGLRTPKQNLYEVHWGGAAVGHLWLTPRTLFGITGLFVSAIYLTPAARGKGLGREVLAWAEAEAKRAGFSEISLHVFGANTGARRLYESLGFASTSVQMAKRF